MVPNSETADGEVVGGASRDGHYRIAGNPHFVVNFNLAAGRDIWPVRCFGDWLLDLLCLSFSTGASGGPLRVSCWLPFSKRNGPVPRRC